MNREEYKNKGVNVRITGLSAEHVNYTAKRMGVKIRKHYRKNNETVGYGYFKVEPELKCR